ncbi:glycine cleavage system H protein [Paracoccidioides lutzii Pb01]|uniref:Glycine cleavage system H protein n=1 Tax=Paracoccidioides lutzii (strain ATCC MYA-826 / Pb01) TaxID=502779 RepID=C1GWP0_PARBA|nr:glycine cleavage system H protein [Paracoccidioides lutzii Pb01]EEH40959.1 glycine cleavage system H protein [Paracoccidioides lutzii Pb01]
MSAATIRILNPLRCGLCASFPRVSSPALRTASYAYNFRPAFRDSRRAFSRSSLWQAKKYTEQHEWVELSEDRTTATIGITEYAANALGEVVYAELPAVDFEVDAGETIGAVESVKSASDIMSPLSGTVIEVNTKLEESPKIINKSPEEQGWFAKIKVVDETELEKLMDKKEYQAKLEEQEVDE